MAELLKHYFPRHVELHNYIPANSFANKLKNWNWLNDKVGMLHYLIRVLSEVTLNYKHSR